eukprot:scaffold799_cov107-Skeletonema_marinoi.AAC.6
MRAAAAPLPGSLLWIFGELLVGLIGEGEGLGTGAPTAGNRSSSAQAQSDGIGTRLPLAKTTVLQ